MEERKVRNSTVLQGKDGYVELKGISFENEKELESKYKKDIDDMSAAISILYTLTTCTPKDLFPPDSYGDTFTKIKEEFYKQITTITKCADRIVKYDIAKDIIKANNKPLKEIIL